MAIVKTHYTKTKAAARRTIDYISRRLGKEKEQLIRALFGYDGEIDKEKAYQLVENARKGTKFHHMKISPDPHAENLDKRIDLRELTIQTMLKLQERLGERIAFVAAIHDDHTDIAHAHAVVLVRGRVEVADLAALREAATGAALFQRRMLDRMHVLDRQRSYFRRQERDIQQPIGMAGGKARRVRYLKEPLPPCPDGGTHSMVKLKSEKNKYYCPVHEKVYEQEQGLSL